MKNFFKSLVKIFAPLNFGLLISAHRVHAATVAVPSSVPTGPSVSDLANGAINGLIYIAGIASVIVIIVGGIMYVVSGGNPDSVKKAKDAILYAVIGLVISLAAFAIVNFVIGRL